MSDDTITIEVDGKPVEARKGQMIIEATDANGAYVPRFCYHEKLSVAANCRMCLVEVEKAPKPMPACATPVADGMKVFTRSPYAIAAQKATMEFLLINHPLDCPICDQGGECELQDLAMGFGRDVSRYHDQKRVVRDKDIGSLVSTDMTRCIHCTRCVRFGEEITGMPQLGTTERGEHMKIGTYIEKSIDHELSANIIDLCPVGALNNKPYRYSARAWEMMQRETVSPHDCVGSNMYVHALRGTIKRVVPKANEDINETWLPDRDRFSYEGVYSADRLLAPQVREHGHWRETSWDNALHVLVKTLKEGDSSDLGILASPGSTVEEGYLLARLATHLGTSSIDHRLRRRDFSDQDNDAVYPWLGCSVADLEAADAILVAGSNLRSEAPILAHRVRKSALAGGKVCFANSERYPYYFDVAAYAADAGLVELLAGVAVAASKTVAKSIKPLCKGVKATDEQKRIAQFLADSDNGVVILGLIAGRHPAFSAIRALAAAIAKATGCRFGFVTEGANTAGAHLAGVLPHRQPGGKGRDNPGNTVGEIAAGSSDMVLLFGVEPDKDLAADAVDALADRNFVVAMTPYFTPALEKCADLLLPIGTVAESSGTYVNCEGRWQSFPGVANPVGEARPGWKVLRVLGNMLDAADFDYLTSEEVRDELQVQLGEIEPDNSYDNDQAQSLPGDAGGDDKDLDVAMYEIDGLVRRATALQLTPEALRAKANGGSA
jgi:NADH-quinone oxidoreductase subunit G